MARVAANASPTRCCGASACRWASRALRSASSIRRTPLVVLLLTYGRVGLARVTVCDAVQAQYEPNLRAFGASTSISDATRDR
jgi:hypothetical protein